MDRPGRYYASEIRQKKANTVRKRQILYDFFHMCVGGVWGSEYTKPNKNKHTERTE